MLDWLHARAAKTPVLFIVEDLHWVDASTLEFLRQFLAEGLHDSILTLLTFRPEFTTPWPAVAHQTSLALNRLTQRQAGDLMRTKTKRALSDAMVQQIYDRTGGVPLFVEEFTTMVQESALPDQEDGSSRGQMLLAHEIPATLQDLVMARLDRIQGEREFAQLAATLGREFSYEVLAAVADLDEWALQRELAELVQAEILYRRAGRPAAVTSSSTRCSRTRCTTRWSRESASGFIGGSPTRWKRSSLRRPRQSRSCSPIISVRRVWPRRVLRTG